MSARLYENQYFYSMLNWSKMTIICNATKDVDFKYMLFFGIFYSLRNPEYMQMLMFPQECYAALFSILILKIIINVS